MFTTGSKWFLGTGVLALVLAAAYGWTTGELMAKVLELSSKVDCPTVMNMLHALPGVKDVGLQLPDSTWTTGPNDNFIGETFQMVQYNASQGHTDPVGSLIDDNGKTASLSPQELLNS